LARTAAESLKKKPRFFCDNCGVEVGRDAKSCPRCGRFFASIRCPACGFAGEERLFSGGCPACGYSSPPKAGQTLREKKTPSGSLPAWVYIIAVSALIAVLAFLLFALIR
jgi:predicted RNA-binding Zn-ribbon protein involved in translation (DUF1610 family)